MMNQNVPQKQSRLNPVIQKRERLSRIEANETNAEIREALRGQSATSFVTSRLEWRLSLGLNTSQEVSR